MPTKKQTKKLKKGAWFIKVRRSYLPCSWQGWLSYVPFVLLGIFPIWYTNDMIQMCRLGWADLCFYNDTTFLRIFTLSTIVELVIYYGALYLVMTWLAKRKS